MAVFLFLWVFFCLPWHVSAYRLVECNQAGNFDIVEKQPASITCTGNEPEADIFWSLNGSFTGGKEMEIGYCAGCFYYDSFPNWICPLTCAELNISYALTRDFTESTLRFAHGLNLGETAIIKCSGEDGLNSTQCTVNAIRAYRLPSCKNNSLEVVDNGKTPIPCTNLQPDQSMYWSIVHSNGTEEIVARCHNCRDRICSCTAFAKGYVVQRDLTHSILHLLENSDTINDGSTVRCSKRDNRTSAECQIDFLNYRLPQCTNGQIQVSEVSPWTPIVCQDLPLTHSINWTITTEDGVVLQAATCANEANGYHCDADDGFTASRTNGSVSQLRMVKRVRDTVNNTVTCLRQDGAAAVSCRLGVVYPAELHNPTVNVDSDFTVSGRVEISKVFATDNNITCRWFYTQGVSTRSVTSTILSLAGFTDGGVSYQRGVCVMETQVNTTQTSYTFTVDIQPGTGHVFAGTVDIKKPGSLQLEASSCPKFVEAGSDLRCHCGHLTSPGSPAASVQWQNTTHSPVLEVLTVHSNQSGRHYVCSSVWAAGTDSEVRSSVNYTLWVKEAETAAEESDSLNLTAVIAGCVSSVVLIVVSIVVIVVIRYRKSTKKEPEPTPRGTRPVSEDYEIPDTAPGTEEARGTYDSLQQSDIGLRSTYTELTNNDNSHSAISESRNPYEVLQHSEIGLRSTYCDLENHGNGHSNTMTR